MRRGGFIAATLLLTSALFAPEASAKRSLADYRWFRAITIDLSGRIPTRAEVETFEKDDFNLDAFVDAQLTGPGYTERVRRIYMDALRLQIGRSFQFVPSATTLRRHAILVEGGATEYVFFRSGQRRKRNETDGTFCLTQDETGLQFPSNATPTGTAKPIKKAALDAATILVKPWWLYRDYKKPSASDRYSDSWAKLYPNFVPQAGLLTEADGSPTNLVRVCKEEASTAATGTIYTTGRVAVPSGTPAPFGRLTQLPLDSTYAKANAGKTVSCTGNTEIFATTDCGCGVGLEKCMPATSPTFDPQAFAIPSADGLGVDDPLAVGPDSQSAWIRLWWGEEAQHFLDYIASEDRDFKEVLTAKYSIVNGPLTQFYRSVAPATCCGSGADFGYTKPEAIFDPAKLPDLSPHETAKWTKVDDRGEHAAGILTMPVFLTKYGSRRARAHAVYQAFQCRDFVAGNVKLEPSTEPDLTKRSGCSTCHVTLEPMSAYFARVVESDWTWLPKTNFPVTESTKCKNADPLKLSYACKAYYDPAFTTAASSKLRGTYASEKNAEDGPPALAAAIANGPEFAPCVVSRVTESFLGRTLSTDDGPLRASLAETFTAGGFKLRALVRALVKADAYRSANNLTSTAWRGGGK